MPRFLEERLKKEYGKDSDIPYKIMNKLGFMHGNKETSKGKKAEEKHEKGIEGEKDKEIEMKKIKKEVSLGGKLDDKTRGQILNKIMRKK